MPLTFPHPDLKPFIAVSSDNLASVLDISETNAYPLNTVATGVALNALDEINEARPDGFHTFRKFVAGTLLFGSIKVGIPAAVFGVGGYFGWPFLKNNLMNVGLSAVGGLAAEKLMKWTLHIEPITYIFMGINDTLHFVAKRASDECMKGYTKKEDEFEKLRDKNRATILGQLKPTWEGIAQELLESHKKASETPQDLSEIKQRVMLLQKKMPIIMKRLSDCELSSSEVDQTIDQLRIVLNHINQQTIEFKVSKSSKDKKFNFILMSTMNSNNFVDYAIPDKCIYHLNAAAQVRFGFFDKIEASTFMGVAAVLGGLVAPGVVGTEHLVCDKLNLQPYKIQLGGQGLVACIGALGFLASSMVAYHYYKIRRERNALADQHLIKAKEDLTGIYNGIADSLNEQFKTEKGKVHKIEALKKAAFNIGANIRVFHKEYSKKNPNDDPKQITDKLQKTVDAITTEDRRKNTTQRPD